MRRRNSRGYRALEAVDIVARAALGHGSDRGEGRELVESLAVADDGRDPRRRDVLTEARALF